VNEQNLKLLAACLLTLITSVLFNTFFMSDKLAERVIHKLKREYVPGPYEPGFDPDKVPPRSMNVN